MLTCFFLLREIQKPKLFHVLSPETSTKRRSRASQRLAKKVVNFSKENRLSSIIRTTKGKRTIMLKFHQFYSPKNTRKDTHKSRKPIFPNWKQQKTHLSQRKKKQKIEKKIRNFPKLFLTKVSGKSHSAENVEESFTLAKRFVSCENWRGELQ